MDALQISHLSIVLLGASFLIILLCKMYACQNAFLKNFGKVVFFAGVVLIWYSVYQLVSKKEGYVVSQVLNGGVTTQKPQAPKGIDQL